MQKIGLTRGSDLLWRAVSAVAFLGCAFVSPSAVRAQSVTFGGNAQHTSNYTPPAQDLNRIKWTASIDFNNTAALVHYGSPLVTAANTVLAPQKIANDGFQVSAFNGASGVSKYTLSTDYILPDHNWIPAYNPCIATGTFGTRLYYAGAGGTIWHIDNPDSNTPGTPVREVFYTSLADYNANASAYNNTVFVDTPLTADSNGNIFFGFRIQGTAPAPLSTTQSGYARIDTTGHGTFVLAGTAANDALIDKDSHNLAPALSNDGTTVYVAVKWPTNLRYCYLLGLDSTSLQTKYSVFLRDPRSGSPAGVQEDGTASPLVAPDGDVYFGVLGNPATNGSRGFLLRFSADLSVTKTPGGFGWDYTAGVVPASMVPSYHGTSSYLLFCKYNDYDFQDGTGVNRVALIDPNATQIDGHSSSAGLIEMREVLTVIGPTPDAESPDTPNAVREWCINAPAVNPATNSVFFNSEDGHLYRWNLATNSLDQTVSLNQGIGQPYVPTVIGPDGTVFTLNGGTMFALGNIPSANVTLSSSAPDLRETVFGEAITFTATITSAVPAPTGTVTFTDLTYNGLNPVTTTLASNVPLDGNGRASITTSSLIAGGAFLGNDFITVTYSGDINHAPGSMTLMQKVHAYGSTTILSTSPGTITQGQTVSFMATVSSNSVRGAVVPSGMVTFYEDGNVIAQVPLDANGTASATKSIFNYGTHTITATYASDTQCAASGASNTLIVNAVTPPRIQLSAATFAATEGANTLDVVVTRTGDISGSSTVDYVTSDTADPNNCGVVNGAASSRCDYLATQGTLHFAAGDISQTIKIFLIDDNRAEGSETFTINLSNVTTATLASPDTATLTINDNETVNGSSNPFDQVPYFVRQQYLDFLDREPDQGGLSYWIDQIAGNAGNDPAPCANGDASCLNTRRTNVSNAFFFEPEFQQTGAFVYRLYRAAYGNTQPIPNPATSPNFPAENLKMPSYQIFAQDRAAVRGGSNLAQEQLALANAFVQRSAFVAKYPLSLTTDQFVDAVLANTASIGATLTSERAKLISLYNSLGRGGVMYRLADDSLQTNPINNRVFIDAEYNRAFVYTQYAGYLRRNSDIDGFVFWLGQVTNGPLRDTGKLHAMVCSFITSDEYQLRFSTVLTHNNTECPH